MAYYKWYELIYNNKSKEEAIKIVKRHKCATREKNGKFEFFCEKEEYNKLLSELLK